MHAEQKNKARKIKWMQMIYKSAVLPSTQRAPKTTNIPTPAIIMIVIEIMIVFRILFHFIHI